MVKTTCANEQCVIKEYIYKKVQLQKKEAGLQPAVTVKERFQKATKKAQAK